jgi:prepilin-type processing-associated H-X9-DG protein
VVISIIGILASLLLPALASGKTRAKRVQCLSNLRQVNVAFRLYTDSNRDKLPKVGSGNWAWDVPWDVGSSMLSYAGNNKKVFYCASSGFTDEDNNTLWNFTTNSYRVIGYAMTFPGTASVLPINQNPSVFPQPFTDPASGLTQPAQPASSRALMADAVISQPGNGDEKNRWLNSYTGIKGGFVKLHNTAHLDRAMPAGGNVAMLDGHAEWRRFALMRVRTDVNSGAPVFWW